LIDETSRSRSQHSTALRSAQQPTLLAGKRGRRTEDGPTGHNPQFTIDNEGHQSTVCRSFQDNDNNLKQYD